MTKYKWYKEDNQTFFNKKGQIKRKFDRGKNKMPEANLEAMGIQKNENGEYVTASLSPTLKAEDLGKKGTTVTALIKAVVQRQFEDGLKPVLTVYVPKLEKSKDGAERTLTLNKTNTVSMLNTFGVDYDEWINKQISIHVEQTLFKGSMTDCIRLYPED